MARDAFYIDFDVVTSEPRFIFGVDRNQDELRLISDKTGVSGLVAMIHIRRTPASGLIGNSPQVPIWAALLERSGVRSVLGLDLSCDPTDIQESLETLSRANPTELLAFFIVFDHADLEALDYAKAWANWGRSCGWVFVIGASKSVGRHTLTSEIGHFDFFYVSDADESLLHAPRLILEQHSSFVSFDFADLRSAWKGRTGQIWRIPARISSIELLLNEGLEKFGEIKNTDFILRYDGPSGLDVVDEFAQFLVDALQPNESLFCAWQTQDNQENGRLELCLMNDLAQPGPKDRTDQNWVLASGSGILKLPVEDEGDECRIGRFDLAKSFGLPTIASSVIDPNQL